MSIKMIPYYFIAFSAVPIFYLIYFRHFFNYYRQKQEKPVYIKHLESFLYGVALALIIILFAPYIDALFNEETVITNAFVKAALIEKTGSLIIFILIVQWYQRFSILEGIVSGIAIGSGFSLVENIIYAMNFGPQLIIARLLFSAPLHLTTCGIMGYYFSAMMLSTSAHIRILRFVLACIVPVVLHGTFDAVLLKDGNMLLIAGPFVIMLVVVLELCISRSKLIPPRQSLQSERLRLEDWFLKYRQPRFERWILNSTGTSSNIRVPLLRAHKSKILWALAILLLGASVTALPYGDEICIALGLNLNHQTGILLTAVYPASIGMTLVMVGIINPDFFRFSIVRIPIIFDAVVHRKNLDDNLTSFDITSINCFLRTFEPLEMEEIEMHFEMRNLRSPRIKARPIWENHGEQNSHEPVGTIIKITDSGAAYYFFIVRYFLFRFWKGIVFNLKLPGFEAIRRLFMSPTTVMQKEVVYHPGAAVFKQGESSKFFYYIKKGKVNIIKELESGERIILETMQAGQIINEMAILGNTNRGVTAECETRCVLAEAQSDNLEALIQHDPHFALALVRKLLNRVDSTQNQLASTIEYLQNLIVRNEKYIKNSVILIALLLGNKPEKSTVTLQLPDDCAGMNIPIPRKDLVRFVRDSFSLNGEGGPEGKTADTIDAILKDLHLDIK